MMKSVDCLGIVRWKSKPSENTCSLLSVQEHVIVETILYGWSITQATSIKALHCLPQDVSTGVPVHLRMG